MISGKREAEEGKVSMRRLGSPDKTVLGFDEAIKALAGEARAPG